MTNDLLIYDGRRDEWFRVVDYRYPKKGETYIGQTSDGEVMDACFHYPTSRHILTPTTPPPPSKEWLDLREAAEKVVDFAGEYDRARDTHKIKGQLRSELTHALAALPTTEPQERFFVEGGENEFHVREKRGAAVLHIAKFRVEQDAKDFAALKNAQEANQ